MTSKYIDRKVIITVRDYFKEDTDFNNFDKEDLIYENYGEEDGFLERHFLTDESHYEEKYDENNKPIVYINNGDEN